MVQTLFGIQQGASHHMTTYMNNLTLHNEEYLGLDEIQVGNGACIYISHHGSSKNIYSFEFSLLRNENDT